MWFYKLLLLITTLGWTVATLQLRSFLRKHGRRRAQMYVWAITGFGLTATSYLLRVIYWQPDVVNIPAFVFCVGGTFALFVALRQGSRMYREHPTTSADKAADYALVRFKRQSASAKRYRGDAMTTITWNALERRFCIEFCENGNRDVLKAAIKATPGASLSRFETQDSVPVNPTSENIIVLWVTGYVWTDEATQEALQRVMPIVQQHLFSQES